MSSDDIGDFTFLTRHYNVPWKISCLLTDAEVKNLVKFHAGESFYIPMLHEYYNMMMKQYDEEDQIVVPRKIYETCGVLFRFIGTDRFLALVDVYGGRTLRIPTQKELLNYLRDRAIYEKHNNGSRYEKLALEFQMPIPRVRKIVSTQRSLANQQKEYTKKHLELKRAIVGKNAGSVAAYYKKFKSLLGVLMD
jgi:hypothetical protein